MTRYSARQVPQCVGLALRLLPVLTAVTISSQGTKAPVKTLEVRDRRSPLTTRRMSRIAKGSYCRARRCQNSARADSQKRRSPVPLPAVLANGRTAGGVDANPGAFLPERGFIMRNRIDIDSKHSRAIGHEIGERLRTFLKLEKNCARS
jgi:hypothetical protein